MKRFARELVLKQRLKVTRKRLYSNVTENFAKKV